MMKKLVMGIFWLIKMIFKCIFIFCLSFIVSAFLMMGIDYLQVQNNRLPVFCISSFDSNSRIENFQSFFYRVSRKVSASTSEPLSDSKTVQFYIFTLKIPIHVSSIMKQDTVMEVKSIENCEKKSELYYSDSSVSVYTYCLEDIFVISNFSKKTLKQLLEQDVSILDDIEDKFGYQGLLKDQHTLEFVSRNDSFTNLDLKIYHCEENQQKKFYIGLKDMEFQKDFCIFHD